MAIAVADPAGRRQQLGRRAGQDGLTQNVAIGAAAVGLAGHEGEIFRKVIGWSLLFMLIMAVLVLLRASYPVEYPATFAGFT